MEDYMSLCCMVHMLSWGTISMASLPYVHIINTLILLNRGVSVGVGWGCFWPLHRSAMWWTLISHPARLLPCTALWSQLFAAILSSTKRKFIVTKTVLFSRVSECLNRLCNRPGADIKHLVCCKIRRRSAHLITRIITDPPCICSH